MLLLDLPVELLERIISFCYEPWSLLITEDNATSALNDDSSINTHIPTHELDAICKYLQPITRRARSHSFSSVLYDDLDRTADLTLARFEAVLSKLARCVRHVRVVRPHAHCDCEVYRSLFPRLESLDSMCSSGRFPNMRSVVELMPCPEDVVSVLGGRGRKTEQIERVLGDPAQHGWGLWLRARGVFGDETVASYWTIKFHFLTCGLDVDGHRHPLPSAGYVGDMSFRFRFWYTDDTHLNIKFDHAWVKLDDSTLQDLGPEQYMQHLMLVR